MFIKNKTHASVIAIIFLVLLIAGVYFAVSHTRLFKNSPNIVIILTDDMDMKLLPYMEKTNELIGKQGVTFTNYFITTPLCCPSRTSLIRGQYSHNTDILDNAPAFVRFFKLQEETETLAVWLNRAGYETALIGKYLNLYPTNAGRNYVPPGWTDWHAFIYEKNGEDFYYNYTMNENGELVKYGDSPEDYSTDVIRDKSIRFINSSIEKKSPFFILISVYPPHGPSTPAPRHAELYSDIEYPQTPSFNEEDISDKPKIIQAFGSTGDEFDAGDANALFRKRVQTVQSADELVADVVTALEQAGQLANTYILFMSDNGFHMGEHKFPSGKGVSYEEDILVPFMIRGPGIAPQSQITQMTANIDIAPTIAGLTDTSVADFVDGRSLLPLLFPEENTPVSWRNGLLIEIGYGNETTSSFQNISFSNKTDPLMDYLLMAEYPDTPGQIPLTQIEGGASRAIRGQDYIYLEYENGEIEFYDLANDPYQLNNMASSLDSSTRAMLHEHLEKLKYCTAESCRQYESELPASVKIK